MLLNNCSGCHECSQHCHHIHSPILTFESAIALPLWLLPRPRAPSILPQHLASLNILVLNHIMNRGKLTLKRSTVKIPRSKIKHTSRQFDHIRAYMFCRRRHSKPCHFKMADCSSMNNQAKIHHMYQV